MQKEFSVNQSWKKTRFYPIITFLSGLLLTLLYVKTLILFIEDDRTANIGQNHTLAVCKYHFFSN
jgi:hypothetical protein